MGPLGSFLQLSTQQRRLHVVAASLDGIFRVLVLVAPFAVSRSLALQLTRVRTSMPAAAVIRAVRSAGLRMPGSNCLSEALSAWVLLACAGYDPRLQIGVSNEGAFRAHAWVTLDDRVVLGGDSADGFQPLAGSDPMRRSSRAVS